MLFGIETSSNAIEWVPEKYVSISNVDVPVSSNPWRLFIVRPSKKYYESYYLHSGIQLQFMSKQVHFLIELFE
jgi:hypothetical protein